MFLAAVDLSAGREPAIGREAWVVHAFHLTLVVAACAAGCASFAASRVPGILLWQPARSVETKR